ncbi:unnamed protein product [Trichobilharzia regenti]|nr:unnamed protein product [Trichobilharzia regenti]
MSIYDVDISEIYPFPNIHPLEYFTVTVSDAHDLNKKDKKQAADRTLLTTESELKLQPHTKTEFTKHQK